MGAVVPLSQVRDLERERDALATQVRELTDLLVESRQLLAEAMTLVQAPEGSRWVLLPERAAIDLAWICRAIWSERIAARLGGVHGQLFSSVADISLDQVIAAVEQAFGVAGSHG